MRCLPKPTDNNSQPYSVGDVFENCVSMVKNTSLKAALRSVRQNVESESADYDLKGARRQLYLKQSHSSVGRIPGIEMVKVYTLRMVAKNSTGRPIYDRIMSLPTNGKCPLCGIGTVSTLDHFLPKMSFPVYSVTPNNLVPACTWCQTEKSEYYSATDGEQLLHPYFDDLDAEAWLASHVISSTPAAFRFFASPPNGWSAAMKARVTVHLKKLKLLRLFSSNAGSRLSEIRGRLVSLHNRGGASAVRAHLREELTSLEAEHKNSWAAAMYRSAAGNDWFCDGGFAST
jgi:hypothetical protein